MNAVTLDDVLAGHKKMTVSTRRGEQKEITIAALPWRTALHVSALLAGGDTGRGTVEAVAAALPGAKDALLDTFVPADLVRIAEIALQLSNGVDEAKKRMARNGEAPASAITSPSSASSLAAAGLP